MSLELRKAKWDEESLHGTVGKSEGHRPDHGGAAIRRGKDEAGCGGSL